MHTLFFFTNIFFFFNTLDKCFQDESGQAHEKLIVRKEKALKAREEELKRNLQELGQDVAAITANAPSEATELPASGNYVSISYLFHRIIELCKSSFLETIFIVTTNFFKIEF